MKTIHSFAALLKNDIKLMIGDWKACLLLLAAPAVFIAFFTYALAPYLEKDSFVEPFAIALADKEGTVQTRMLVKQLDEMEIFSKVIRIDEAAAMKMLAAGEVASVIIIPEDFTTSIAAGENRPVKVIGNASMPLQSGIVKNLMQSAANLVSAAQSAINTIYAYNVKAGVKGSELEDQFYQSTMKLFLETLARTEIIETSTEDRAYGLTAAEYFTAALIVVFIMFAGMPAMKMLVSERLLGVTARLAASPARRWQIIVSKLLVSMLLSVVQFGVIILFTSLAFKSYWGAPAKEFILLFGALVFAVSSWSVFVSAVSPTPAAADVLGNLGILLMAVAGGSIYPLTSMPEFVRKLSSLTINRWAMDGFMVLFSGNVAARTAQQSMALAIIGLVLLTVSMGVMKIRR